MLRTLWTVAALAAALALPAATAAGSHPGPPLTQHETTCDFGQGFEQVTMWLTAGMAAGDTFWLDGGGHYVIQSYRSAVTDSSTVVPGEEQWSEPQTLGRKVGRSGTQIECRGNFDQGDGTFSWVDSTDYLIK